MLNRLVHTSRRPLTTLFLAALVALAAAAVIVAPVAAARSGECAPTLEPRGTMIAGQPITIVGTACGPTQILVRAGARWRVLANALPNPNHRFNKRIHVAVKKGVKAIEVKASTRHNGVSPAVRVPVEPPKKGNGKPDPTPEAATGAGSETSVGDASPTKPKTKPSPEPVSEAPPTPLPTPTPTPIPTPEPEPTPSPEPTPEPTPEPNGCPLGATSTQGPIPMVLPGCRLVSSDTAAESSPINFWSEISCANSSRYSWGTTGGDTQLTATGAPQGNEDFRRTTVLDGDEVYGERCELGRNDHRYGHTAFYHQGEHEVTYFSERLPSNFPLSTNKWQTVMQMKQAQPADGGGGAPIVEMEARGNRWVVVDNWQELWSFPAQTGKWTRFAWDVYYSQDPNQGWLQVSVDLNGDGDFNDPGERSPVLHAATLKTEIEGPNGATDGLAAGQPIPSHLRMGIYHDPSIACPAPTGCSVELDNVQVVAPQ